MTLNSPENQANSARNDRQTTPPFTTEETEMENQKKQRGPYGAGDLLKTAVDKVQMAKKHLRDIVAHPELSTEDVVRLVSLAAMYVGEAGENVQVAKSKYEDYFRRGE